MNKRAGWSLCLAAVALFLVLNRPAYKGYFQSDDFDTMGWARLLPLQDFAKWLITPQMSTANFRPVGAFYYHVMMNSFGLDFPKYLVPLHVLHLLNIWLVWLLIRKLGLGPLAATAGAFFFGFHAALIDAWWKPMFVFDLLCGTFSIAAFVLYAYDRWIMSLVALWLAYKSKELAIMLPVALACYELWFGGKRWKRLAPFFAVSALFGLQALILRPGRGQYELQLGWGAQSTTLGFYASQLFFTPYAGFLLLAVPLVIHSRQAWLGVVTMCAFIAPLLLLPGRLFAVYWYVPLIGAAILVASLAESRRGAVVTAVFLALWIPWDFVHFREIRRLNARQEQQYHGYVAALQKYARRNPDQRLFVWDYLPDGFGTAGVAGALGCVYLTRDVTARGIDEPVADELIQNGDATWLRWNRVFNRLDVVHYPHVLQPAPYVVMASILPAGQLVSGWYRLEGDIRWSQPDATALLYRPESARTFELVTCPTEPQIAKHQEIDVQILLDGRPFVGHAFTTPGCQTVRWPVPHGTAGPVRIEFHSTPPYRYPPDTRVFGITVKAFGFVAQ
jgi:hypothetical protein